VEEGDANHRHADKGRHTDPLESWPHERSPLSRGSASYLTGRVRIVDQVRVRKGQPMKLTTITNVSIDGVMQGLGAADEDRSGGFERGGWAIPLFDNEAATFLNHVYQRADAFLFGRRTYEIFAGSWGTGSWGTDQGNNPISVALNTRPKYVASTTLADPQWADTTVLSGDVAAAIGELKAKPAGELQVHGSGRLVRWLFDNQLVDEIILLIYPVVVGQGTRLFPDTGPDTALELIHSQSTPKGVTIQVYRPTGPPQYATGSTD
jgi:dihydrofolate reductase